MAQIRPRLLDTDALWTYALKLLGGRAHSTGELREKLRRRAEQASAVEDVMARLKENGYLDDQHFAEGFATARLANGHILVTSYQSKKAVELDRSGKPVWEYESTARLTRAWRH